MSAPLEVLAWGLGPTPKPNVVTIGMCDQVGVSAICVSTDTHELACTACGGHSRLDLQDVGNGMRALLCCHCRQAFHQHVDGGDIAAC